MSGELWTTAGTELRIARVAARRRLGTLPPRVSTLRHATSQLARANDALARRLNGCVPECLLFDASTCP